jgi:isoquinoline 1-oxidoreductase alpha subunit
MTIALTINNEPRQVDVDGDMPLLWVLRDELRLTGTKFGCGMAQCGACTVQVDGRPVRSCVTPVSAAAGARVVTIEGLAGPAAEAVREAWVELDTPQCGYCQSGQIIAAEALLRTNAKPSDADIDAALAGNLCRCATYQRVRKAIHRAADTLGRAGK